MSHSVGVGSARLHRTPALHASLSGGSMTDRFVFWTPRDNAIVIIKMIRWNISWILDLENKIPLNWNWSTVPISVTIVMDVGYGLTQSADILERLYSTFLVLIARQVVHYVLLYINVCVYMCALFIALIELQFYPPWLVHFQTSVLFILSSLLMLWPFFFNHDSIGRGYTS